MSSKAKQIVFEDVPIQVREKFDNCSRRQPYKCISFPGNLPVSYSTMPNLTTPNHYLASRKWDGVRFFAIYFCGEDGRGLMYMFDKASNVCTLEVACPKSFVCDLELLESEIIVFDCVEYDGTENQIFVPFRHRGVTNVSENLQVEGFSVRRQVFWSTIRCLELYDEETWEGIVFTPKKHNYFSMDDPILKWKPPSRETFDYKIVDCSEVRYEEEQSPEAIFEEAPLPLAEREIVLDASGVSCGGSDETPLPLAEGEIVLDVSGASGGDSYPQVFLTKFKYVKVKDCHQVEKYLRVIVTGEYVMEIGSICEFLCHEEGYFSISRVRTDVGQPNPFSRYEKWKVRKKTYHHLKKWVDNG